MISTTEIQPKIDKRWDHKCPRKFWGKATFRFQNFFRRYIICNRCFKYIYRQDFENK